MGAAVRVAIKPSEEPFGRGETKEIGMKTLSMDDLLRVAAELKLPRWQDNISMMEVLATQIAIPISAALGVRVHNHAARYVHGKGVITEFKPDHPNTKCPKVLSEADPQGDWSFKSGG